MQHFDLPQLERPRVIRWSGILKKFAMSQHKRSNRYYRCSRNRDFRNWYCPAMDSKDRQIEELKTRVAALTKRVDETFVYEIDSIKIQRLGLLGTV